MEVINKIKIDLLKPGLKPMINAMQADENSRVLEITLNANGSAWEIPDGASFSMAYKKPDGTKGLYDTLPDGSSAFTVDGNTVSVVLAPQMLTAPGTVTASVVISAGDQRINTFPIIVNVIQNPAVGAVGSEDYFYSSVIGNLDDLKTTNKTSLVAAINEIFSTGGSGSDSGQNVAQPDLSQNDPTQPDYVKNRTHWEENNQTVIEWDGSTEGREMFNNYVKISDLTPSVSELVGATVTMVSTTGETQSVTIEEDSIEEENGVISIRTLQVFVILDAEAAGTSVGVYVRSTLYHDISAFTITFGSTTIHQLDEKFIPDTIARISDIPEILGSDVLIVTVESGEVIEEEDNGENVWTRSALTADYTAEDVLAAVKAGKMVYAYLAASGSYMQLRQEMGGILYFWEHNPGSTISIWADSDTNEWVMEYYDRYRANGLVFANPYGEMSSVAVGDGLEIQRDEDGYPVALKIKNATLPMPTTATVGQYIVVSAVDENGKVTATEAVTMADAEGVAF